MKNCHHNPRPEYKINNALKIIKQYSFLLDSFILDYHVDKHWEKLPVAWQTSLEHLNFQEIASILNNNDAISSNHVLPLSLLTLKKLSNFLSVPREASFFKEGCIKCTSKSDPIKKKEKSICFQHPKLKNIFNKNVKPKKRHEIMNLAEICTVTSEETGCKYIIDIGSGLGHLARNLAFEFKMKVCCLEAQNDLTLQARKLDIQMENLLKKFLSEEELKSFYKPVHLNKRLEKDTTANDLENWLKLAFNLEKTEQFGIIGLHPCGDLAAILLRLFNQCPNAKFINLAGCCYMKLTPGFGYPLSNFLKNRKEDANLSYESREVACHANENYVLRLKNNNYTELKVHCFRATLEYLIHNHAPDFKHSQIRSVRLTSDMQFTEYCSLALSKLSISIPNESFETPQTKKLLNQWRKVVVFYTLRLLLAPLVETVVLLDRILFLQEFGYHCELIPAFEPLFSPRNQILIAIKN